MHFDVFFSISQTPVDGYTPDEATMFRNWLAQVEAADRLGFGVAWLAESHLSSEVQKRNRQPVVPHWQGEIGLNCDMLQSAHAVFQRTATLATQEQASRLALGGARRRAGKSPDEPLRHGRIEVGSAVMNILQGGGPIAHAERIAYFAALADLDERPGGMSRKPDGSRRRIHVGFSAGRFDYMNRAHGYVPRDDLERALPYPLLKGKIFDEATEVFCRLLAGETLASDDVPERTVTAADCRTDEDWQRIRAAAQAAGRLEIRPAVQEGETGTGGRSAEITAGSGPHNGGDAPGTVGVEHAILPKRFVFEELKVVPQTWRRDLVQLVAGSHDPRIPALANQYLPCQVANLSITPPEVIERTHQHMATVYHPDGGPWRREYMPRTVMVFLNEEPGLSPEERSAAAHKEAKAALSAYWTALEGTLDPSKVEHAADNAVIGNAEEVAAQVAARFHPDDRLMLWFDFFNHDSARVIRNMEAWMERVVPLLPQSMAKVKA